ncbi:hypothetical protein Dred_2019 [Desulforamulus reducens MI-1]|uniref:Uncharacterized protein n=1 Tax=Desulforamulus reducens (strain ATCC BAA-1160 / DSM 100696 / MI-1) TaxID=349161 RepID=A4J633_DESRM|nr:hypothetical protein [Desulforamulus reducens]ABO50536.1 hypothetical protein Dred_2019 [Desulforamulus reducens MI-1]
MYRKGQALKKGLERARQITNSADSYNIDWEEFDSYKFIAEYTDLKDVLLRYKDQPIDIDNIWICELFNEARKIDKRIEQIFVAIKNYETGIFLWKKRWENKLNEIMMISEDLREFEQEVLDYQNITIFSDITNSMVSSSQMLQIIKHKESRAYDYIGLKLSSIENKRVSYLSLLVAIGVTILSALNYFCK